MQRLNLLPDYHLNYIKGLTKANSDILEYGHEPLFVSRKKPNRNKVALVSGGGSGHEPLHCGFVGQGMLDVAVPGSVFSSPSAMQISNAISLYCGKDQDVVFIVKNYEGDRMNFEIASELITQHTAIVMVKDDISIEDNSKSRGISGTIIYEKLLGAAAERGDTLHQLKVLATQIEQNIASLGVKLAPPELQLDSEQNVVEFGVGIHGEPGIDSKQGSNCQQVVAEVAQSVSSYLTLNNRDNVLVVVNGLGGMTSAELYVIFEYVSQYFKKYHITIRFSLVGNFVTSLSTYGFSLTVCKMLPSFEALWSWPVKTSSLRW
ncbi:dihydroxyacetone kinase subunit DhaK [Alteromonas sp. ZYF713]|nr:dihydroxyacetone kinase subunit DhaK [Alteromonas sp. ZYF713]